MGGLRWRPGGSSWSLLDLLPSVLSSAQTSPGFWSSLRLFWPALAGGLVGLEGGGPGWGSLVGVSDCFLPTAGRKELLQI